MIYTVTFSPSLDYVTEVRNFMPGAVNRTAGERIYPGGKGINVSILLHRLGHESTALGFTAGFTGDEIIRLVHAFGCRQDFIPIAEGFSRINVKILSSGETQINGQGPVITRDYLRMLFDKLALIKQGDTLVLAGNTPNTLPTDIYEQILAFLAQKAINIVVDATNELLLNVLKYHPFLIKPNSIELGELFGVTLHGEDEIIGYGTKLQELGARNILVSMAGDGAILITEAHQVLKCLPPKGTLLYTVGAGDSMVAGFVSGYAENCDYKQGLSLGVAAGSATAYSEWLAESEYIRSLCKKTKVEVLDY